MLLAIILLVAAFYVGWNIGANDAANCIGTLVGARVIAYRRAALMMGVFVILGGTLQGHKVMKTVGKGIVITSEDAYVAHHERPAPAELSSYFPDGRLPDGAVLTALLSAGLFVTLATVFSVPVSTSQAIVGGVAGTGIGMVAFQGEYFRLAVLAKIFGSWVISPFLTLILAYVVYSILARLLRNVNPMAANQLLSTLVIGAACYVSFSLGANDVGNAIGPLLNKFPDHGGWLAFFCGIAMAIGALTFGNRVTDTVGKSITPLDLGGAFSAQLSAAVGVHVFSMLGIPVSTSQAVVGAVIGVGLTKGASAVRLRKVAAIVSGWVITPLCAAVCAALFYQVVSRFLV